MSSNGSANNQSLGAADRMEPAENTKNNKVNREPVSQNALKAQTLPVTRMITITDKELGNSIPSE